jgi:hypothetical protein
LWQWNCSCSFLKLMHRVFPVITQNILTEELIIIRGIHLSESSPLDDVRRYIHWSLIDIPCHIDKWCTVADANRVESHLCGWINELIFEVRRTHGRNNATEWRSNSNRKMMFESSTHATAIIGHRVSSTVTSR